MSNIREIKNKIKHIKSTQKITHAMKMVAASKMRKTQERMLASRPYSYSIKEIISHLTDCNLESEHPYLIERETKRAGFIIISTNRGLCGGLNMNLFRVAIEEMQYLEKENIGIDICTVGNKASLFFRRYNANIIAKTLLSSELPSISDIIGPVKVLLDAYESKRIDKIYIVHNEFVNTMTQTPRVEILLPIVRKNKNLPKKHDYLYEPTSDVLLDVLLKRYVESLVYQGVVENIACEQAARMVAMKNASDNAEDLIDEFQLMYNKERQAIITKELSEIVAGADAV